MSLISNKLHHISNEFITGGIHKAFLVDNNGELKVFIPEIHSTNLYEIYSPGEPFNINSSKLLEKINILPEPMWNVPNEQAMKHETPIHPCWVIFENNSIQRPVIMGWCGEGIMYHASNSDSSGGQTIYYSEDGTSTSISVSTSTSTSNNSNYSSSSNISYINTVGGTNAKEHGPVAGTQCVELANDYIESVYGIKNNGGFGHAKDYYSGLASQYSNQFQEISYSSGTQLQAGDIISLRGVQTQYGHVAIVKSVSGNNITILEQWDGSVTVREDTFNINDGGERTIIGIARPK